MKGADWPVATWRELKKPCVSCGDIGLLFETRDGAQVRLALSPLQQSVLRAVLGEAARLHEAPEIFGDLCVSHCSEARDGPGPTPVQGEAGGEAA